MGTIIRNQIRVVSTLLGICILDWGIIIALLQGKKYLNNRNQKVFYNMDWSTVKSVTSGVPQGSILGPLFFFMFINDLPLSIDSKCHMFADDVRIYRSCVVSESNNCINLLNKDIRHVLNWANQNGI